MKTILITGAAGDVGTHLRRELAGKYVLKVSDLRSLKKINKEEKFVRADISKFSDALRITKGVDAVVHMGGYSVEGPWDGILSANIIGCYNVFEAARINGVKRIIFPSSNHATGFYRRQDTIDHRVYPKPDGRYGVSKVFGEALGSLYADKYGMQVFCMRIGNVNPVPIDKRRLSIWFSPRDLAQLVSIGIEHPEDSFRNRLRGVSQRAQLVRQLECASTRLQAAGRRRALCKGSHGARKAGRRSNSRDLPGRNFHCGRGGYESGAAAEENRKEKRKKMNARKPRLAVPAGATDTHMHVYDSDIPSAAGGPPLPGNFREEQYREYSSV